MSLGPGTTEATRLYELGQMPPRWPPGDAAARINGMAYTVVTSRDRPDLVEAAGEAFRQRWPEFIFHDPIPPRYMPRVHEYFPEYDILLLDQGEVAAGGWGSRLRTREAR